jgi:hypothetical protein
MNNFTRNAIVFSLILASIGVFYHFVIFIPKQLKQKEVKYELCKITADDEYIANWASACEMQASYNRDELKNCMSDPQILTNSLMGERWCKENYEDFDSSVECSLSKVRAESVNASRDKALKRCLDEAKTGV